MEEKINRSGDLPPKNMEPNIVVIDKVPVNLNLKDIECKANQCLKNSYNVIQKYPQAKIVEGVICIVDKESCAKAMAHAWNSFENLYFDITAERIWITDEYMQVSEIKYLLTKIHALKDIESIDILEFDDVTKKVVDYYNEALKKSTLAFGGICNATAPDKQYS